MGAGEVRVPTRTESSFCSSGHVGRVTDAPSPGIPPPEGHTFSPGEPPPMRAQWEGLLPWGRF